MKHFGELYKKAGNFEKLQNELPILFRLSDAPLKEILSRTGISETHYRRIINKECTLQPDKAIAILRAIIEIQNYRNIKTKLDG